MTQHLQAIRPPSGLREASRRGWGWTYRAVHESLICAKDQLTGQVRSPAWLPPVCEHATRKLLEVELWTWNSSCVLHNAVYHVLLLCPQSRWTLERPLQSVKSCSRLKYHALPHLPFSSAGHLAFVIASWIVWPQACILSCILRQNAPFASRCRLPNWAVLRRLCRDEADALSIA